MLVLVDLNLGVGRKGGGGHRKDDKGRGEIILGQTLSDAICERSLMVRRYMDKN